MAFFKNPNDPRQPKAGVYGWFFQYRGKTHCLYIGQAGVPASHMERCTLLRGISELARLIFCSNGVGKKLDTDFVVGTAIRYVERMIKAECYWEHIADDPNKELDYCRELHPFIQNPHNCNIYSDLKCASEERGWDITKKTGKTLEQRQEVIQKAETAVFEVLSNYIVVAT